MVNKLGKWSLIDIETSGIDSLEDSIIDVGFLQFDGLELVKKYEVDVFNCSYRQLTPEWIADLQAHQIPYLVYTVNEPDLMKEHLEKGVSGMFTDFPQELMDIVENL